MSMFSPTVSMPANGATIAWRGRLADYNSNPGILIGDDGVAAWGMSVNGINQISPPLANILVQAGGVTVNASTPGVPLLTNISILFTFTTTGVRVSVRWGGTTHRATTTITMPTGRTASVLDLGINEFVGGGPNPMHTYGAFMYSAPLSQADEDKLLGYMDGLNGLSTIYPTDCQLITIAGNSIANGFQLPAESSWAYNVGATARSLGTTNRVEMTAVPGWTLGQMITDYPVHVKPRFNSSRPGTRGNALFVAGATNDMAFGTLTALQVEALYQSYCAQALADGFWVIACTVLPRSDTQNSIRSTFEADRTTFNTWLRANYTMFASIMVDPGGDPTIGVFGASDDPMLYIDKVHLTALGASDARPIYQMGV
jgi:hypothetical protein